MLFLFHLHPKRPFCKTLIYNKNLTTIKPPQSTSASNKEINAEDTQIGNLKLGESLTDINKVYGTPSSKITGPETTWNYNQRGFSVTGSNVWTITISKGFTASTPRGIHIGSSKSAVEKAYADLLPIESNELYGMSSNEQYGIVFAFNGQQVSKITLIDLTDGRFWTPQTNPSILSSTVSSTHNNELKIDSALSKGVTTITITNSTLMWDDGKLVPYSKTPGLKSNDEFSAVVEKQGSQTIAKEIYGPVSNMISGTISKVSGNQITVKELYNPTSKTWKPTGRVITFVYDSRTLFQSPVTSLRPGVFVQITSSGFYPGKLLVQGITAYTISKLPGGADNFTQIQ